MMTSETPTTGEAIVKALGEGWQFAVVEAPQKDGSATANWLFRHKAPPFETIIVVNAKKLILELRETSGPAEGGERRNTYTRRIWREHDRTDSILKDISLALQETRGTLFQWFSVIDALDVL